MNTAQIMLIDLAKKVKAVDRDEKALSFLRQCYLAWEGYPEDTHSYPHWKLQKAEETYGLTVYDIAKRYN